MTNVKKPADQDNDQLLEALRPLLKRVRLDVTVIKTPNGQFWTKEPLTNERMLKHLNGGPARGVAQIKAGESVTMVALFDLDSHEGEIAWPDMEDLARLLCVELRKLGLRPTAFRSSGGRGIHLILLWDEPQDAYSVRRQMWSALDALEFGDGTKGVKFKQIEVFPKQDEVPSDGRGNQFILPLAGESVPLDAITMAPLDKVAALLLKWPSSDPVPYCERPRTVSNASLQTTDVKKLHSALNAIPNSGDAELGYDEWLKVVFGIHHATGGSAEGLALAREFSARSPKHSDYWLERRTWAYIKDDKADPITAGSVFSLARKYGWKDADAMEPFPLSSLHTLDSFCKADFPPLEYVIEGFMYAPSITMIYAPRGQGKTWLAMTLAVCLASGQRFLQWPVTKPMRVLYVDGEMPSSMLQERFRSLTRDTMLPISIMGNEVLYRDTGSTFCINNFLHQQRFILTLQELEDASRGIDLIFFDNLSALTFGLDENDNSAQDSMVQFFRNLRLMGKSVVFLHHSGKSGDQRGASRREDILDLVLKLGAPSSALGIGCQFKLQIAKSRGVEPEPNVCEAKLIVGKDGLLEWSMSEAAEKHALSMADQILQCIESNRPNSIREIARAVGRDESTIREHVDRLRKNKMVQQSRLSLTAAGQNHLKQVSEEDDDAPDF